MSQFTTINPAVPEPFLFSAEDTIDASYFVLKCHFLDYYLQNCIECGKHHMLNLKLLCVVYLELEASEPATDTVIYVP